MSNNTIKQHYVWKEYLRNFSFKEDSIYSLINFSKVVPNNLTNVAQERFFYKLHDITKEEYKFINGFLDNFLKVDDELKVYLKTVQLSYLTTILKNSIKDEKFRSKFQNNIQNDYFESHMTKIENLGKKLILITSLEELKECFNERNGFKTILFISMQFVRTKKQRLKLKEEFKKSKINIDKFSSFLSFSIGNILAYNLVQRRKHKVTILINNTSIEFITSDQPIINLEEETDEDGIAVYFKLYLPLSPLYSIILDFDSDDNTFEELSITDSNYIISLNRKIVSNSNIFIFSKNEKILTNIKNKTY